METGQSCDSKQVSLNITVENIQHLEFPQIKNHTTIIYNKHMFVFGGYDGKKNHNTLFVYNILSKDWTMPKVSGNEPSGRNGHTATLICTQLLKLF